MNPIGGILPVLASLAGPENLSNGICLSRRQRLGPYPHVLEGSHLHKLSQRLVTTPGEVARQIMQQVYTKATFQPRLDHSVPEPRRHGNDTDSAEVRLWDTRTGGLIATWPAPEDADGVYSLAFAPDGRAIAGSVGPAVRSPPPWGVVLWDVDGRRAPRVLRGHASKIVALAFSPDGKTLASGGWDKTVVLWDVATGVATGRLEGIPQRIVSVAFAPDGRTLAIGAVTNLDLWDVPGRRLRARLEPENFVVRSVIFGPDGRFLAVAGRDRNRQGQVQLYDVTKDPPSLEEELTLDRGGLVPPHANRDSDNFNDIAFTPDGRHVVAVSMSSIVFWDAATGAQEDFVERLVGGFEDRLAVSPDGRWLAVLQESSVTLLDIVPPRPP